ncbi:MAG: efflux transporter outer membrane subunit [Rhodocyclaceae bacterium]|nr:efflux transporter outer membrane subunit [Rhodocyclaceae bacterium]
MSKPRQPFSRLAPLAAALLLAGCAVGPDYARPELDLPQTWPLRATAAPEAATSADRAGERWWALYADPTLDRLIDEALAHNADARVAAARVLEARAQAGIADADLYPSISAGLSGSRSQSTLRGAMPAAAGQPRIQNSYRGTLDVAYEVDFWGKYRRASEAARADLLAAGSAREAVLLTLTAQVAQQYFALLAADAQEGVARRTLASREETRALFSRQVAAGIAAEYDLHQIDADAADARARLAELTEARDRHESALALLLGRAPRAVMLDSPERGAPTALPAPAVPAGLPAALLLRRPDLQEAEQRLIAANARIGAARAQYFPSVGLTAYLGSESTAFSDLFSGPAGIFQFAAAITQPIWDAGRIGFGVDAAEARREQALAQYRQAVAAAFKDVRDALAAQRAAGERLTAETARAEALGKALTQARQRYDAGIAGRLDVLDVERNLLAVELARIDSERARRAALADLFKALGGGWSTPADG